MKAFLTFIASLQTEVTQNVLDAFCLFRLVNQRSYIFYQPSDRQVRARLLEIIIKMLYEDDDIFVLGFHKKTRQGGLIFTSIGLLVKTEISLSQL